MVFQWILYRKEEEKKRAVINFAGTLPVAKCIKYRYTVIENTVPEVIMEKQDIAMLIEWFEQNKDHKLNFLEKQAVKLAVGKAETVGDLMETALSLLKGKK